MEDTKQTCACGSPQTYSQCCEPFIKGKKFPATAEQLMRSRYTAYTVADIEYLRTTLIPVSQKDFSEEDTREWAEKTTWKKLSILSTKKGLENDTKGVVEFTAHYEIKGEGVQHHEVSQFAKEADGRWYFVSGEAHSHPGDEDVEESHKVPVTIVRTSEKVGRNDPCSCGSGKKSKKCCGK